jgi:hypothetical protein
MWQVTTVCPAPFVVVLVVLPQPAAATRTSAQMSDAERAIRAQ